MSLAYRADSPNNITSRSNETLPELFRNLSAAAVLEVRSGFFKICVLRVRSGETWDCNSDPMELSSNYGVTEDPLDLIFLSSNFRTDIVFPGLKYVFSLFSLFSPPARRRTKR